MKQKDKILTIGFFRIFVMLLLCAALFSGCADDDKDQDNPGNPVERPPVENLEPGVPASIQIEPISLTEIAVTGVGRPESTTINLQLTDGTGKIIEGSEYKMRARFKSQPKGGEYLKYKDIIDYNSIDIPIIRGVSSFSVQSGNLPGVVEIEVELLHNHNDEPLNPVIQTLIHGVSIASGPPHMLFLDRGRVVSIDPDSGDDPCLPRTPGFYSLRAGLSVNDRWGNPVSDGTVINLGVMDTAITSLPCNVIENDHSLIAIGVFDFTTPFVVREGERRYIEPSDRVIIKDAKKQNKSRFVDEPISDGGSRLFVTKPYEGDESGLECVVGASLLGGSIHGCNCDGTATKGTVQTKEGLGQLRFVYPKSSVDHPEERVISIFTTSDVSHFVLTLVDEGTLGFFPLGNND